MNKVYRDGVKIRIAFSSARRAATVRPEATTEPVRHQAYGAQTALPDEGDQAPAMRSNMRLIMKRVMRPVAKAIYRVFKPMVRPLALRGRRYLVEGLRTDILNELQMSQEALEGRLKVLQGELLETVITVRADMDRSVRSQTDILNELQMSQQTLEGRLKVRQGELLETVITIRADIDRSVRSQYEMLNEAINTAASDMNRAQQMIVARLTAADEGESRLDRIEQYALASARRAAITSASGELLIRTAVGYVLCDANDYAVIAILLEAGELERGTRLLISRILKPGAVYVDVGANIGMHTIAAGRAMNFQGKIFAFEPFEKTKSTLEKSVWINGLAGITEIHQKAVSDKAGSMDLFLGATSGHHSLFPLASDRGITTTSVQVEVVTLDNILPIGQKVDLLKIDVEGAELEVLRGSRSIIERNPDIGIIAEYGPSHLKRTGHTTVQWLQAFADLGLRHMVINENTGAVEDWPLERIESADSVNLLFARKDSVTWARAFEGSPA